jgi:hypothetical protein
LQDLTRRAADAGIDDDLIIPVLYKACRYHDRVYALPLTPWSVALYYNKEIFAEFAGELEEAGYSADRPPRTLDELRGYANIIHRRDAQGEIELMAFLPGFPETVGWFWNAWALWFGGSFRDGEAGEFRVDTDAYLRGYGWVRDYARHFGIRDVLRFESGMANFNSPDNPFMIGKLAMVQMGPFFANMIRKYAPDIDYGVAPFPTVDGREVGFCALDVLTIPKGARHPDEAWAFMEWLYTSAPIAVPSGKAEPQYGYDYFTVKTDTGMLRRPMPLLRPVEWLCWAHYKNGPLVSPSPGFIESHPNPAIDVHERATRGPHAHTVPPLPNWTELLVEFTAAYRDIWSSEVDVGTRLGACQERIDVLVDQARRRLQRHGTEYP